MSAIALSSSIAPSVASADGTTVHLRWLGEEPAEPWLHLDATTLDPAIAEGGIADGRSVELALGPRARLAAEGRWWQSGLAPSMFASDLPVHGWRVGGEVSYDLGPFRVGVAASLTRDGDVSHRMVGLFAYRTFHLSRWMRAWIALGITFDEWEGAGVSGPRQGTTLGLTLGTTFR